VLFDGANDTTRAHVGPKVVEVRRPSCETADRMHNSGGVAATDGAPERGFWPQQAQLGGAILGRAVVCSLGGFIRR
jgi:hypothetical protein